MKKLIISLLIFGFSTLSFAADVEKGKATYDQLCSSCHGVDGKSEIELNPKLNGQFASYLIAQFNDIKNQERNNNLSLIMLPYTGISDEELENISVFLESVE